MVKNPNDRPNLYGANAGPNNNLTGDSNIAG
jgi:hypothetical protein